MIDSYFELNRSYNDNQVSGEQITTLSIIILILIVTFFEKNPVDGKLNEILCTIPKIQISFKQTAYTKETILIKY